MANPESPSDRNRRQNAILRLSCDACGSSKVRCSKERPRCERCISIDIPCIYGESRKFTKGSKRSTANSIGERDQSHPDPRANPMSPSRSNSEASLQSYVQPQITNHRAINPDWTGYEGHISTSSNIQFENSLHSESIENSAFPMCEDNIFTSANGTKDTEAQPGSLIPIDSDFNWSFSFPIDQQDFPMSVYADSPGMPRTSARTHSDISAEKLSEAIFTDRSKTHECSQRAYSALRSLHFGPETASYHIQNYTPTQSLDKVLSCTGLATNELLELLDCPCSHNPHLAMLYASIISKILMCYQVASGCKQPVSWTSKSTTSSHQPLSPTAGSSAGGSSSTFSQASSFSHSVSRKSSSVPLVESAGFSIAPMQISAGSFNIDEKVQDSLRRQLVLSELMRSRQLIDSLNVRGAAGEDAVDNLYAILGRWLGIELTGTIKILENMINNKER